MIYPWQVKPFQQLWEAKQANRLPHALLFVGTAGLGKKEFAEYFSKALLCQQMAADGHVCQSCHACRLITGRAHPNVLWVGPEKEGHAIKVEQTRAINEFVSQTSFQGEYRIVIISPANNMNTNAANALLKTLEEPASGSILILITDQSRSLPATILSRCQRVVFAAPDKETALSWLAPQLAESPLSASQLLKIANGAPLAALKLKDEEALAIRASVFQSLSQLVLQNGDPIKLATKLQDNDPILLLDLMLSWVVDLLRLQLGQDNHEIRNQDFEASLNEVKTKMSVALSLGLMNYLQQLRGKLCAGINFNKQLMLESVFIRCMPGLSGGSHVSG